MENEGAALDIQYFGNPIIVVPHNTKDQLVAYKVQVLLNNAHTSLFTNRDWLRKIINECLNCHSEEKLEKL